jgi:hypothetical protein
LRREKELFAKFCFLYLDEEGKKTAKKSGEIGSSALILDANLSLSTPNRLWLSSKMNEIFTF